MRTVPWSESDASSASFLAIVPPNGHVEAIESVQRKCGIKTDVSPHITVKAQPGLQRPELWREPLAVALRMLRPFELKLGPVGWFGREILYLSMVGETVVDCIGESSTVSSRQASTSGSSTTVRSSFLT